MSPLLASRRQGAYGFVLGLPSEWVAGWEDTDRSAVLTMIGRGDAYDLCEVDGL
ncbi:hypothetical protein GZL_00726 [Streptomyces sp. 769]|nr:hypothetical protein GZL_00726 [Streptomyces sp. 769]